MKTLRSFVVVGAIAATAVAATATGAVAGPGFGPGPGYGPGPGPGPYPPPYVKYHRPHYDNGPGVGGALVAGTILGLAVGAIASEPYAPPPPPPPPPPYPYYAAAVSMPLSGEHYAWCARTYQSYDARTDTFVDFQGIARRCMAPY